MIQRYAFAAMGTRFELLLEAPPCARAVAALGIAASEVQRLEALLSRFRPDSELSRLNASGRLAVGDDLLRLTQLALAARERTAGRFDPTVHNALAAAGYDRSIELVRAGSRSHGTRAVPASGGRVTVDAAAGVIELEPGYALDLGGIAKGYAADSACRLLAAAGACLVNAGGDIAVSGPPADGSWPVGVETARAPLVLALTEGALATSGTEGRRWRHDGRELHHLIDPRTSRPAETDLCRVTVAAPAAVDAEVEAKALLLAGARAALAMAEGRGLRAVLVTAAGRTLLTGGLR